MSSLTFTLASGPTLLHDGGNVGENHVMQFAFVEEGQRLVARPEGRMEAVDGDRFADSVQQRIKADVDALTIDLDGLEFVNFGGIRALLRLARSLKLSGAKLDFVGGNQRVRDALDQAGLDDFFPFTPPYVQTRGTKP